MRIAVSLLSFRPGWVGGAETYLRALLRHLPAVAGDADLVAVMDRDISSSVPTPGFHREVLPLGARRLVTERILEAYTPWRAHVIEDRLRAIDADVVFFPQQTVFPALVASPVVLAVGDIQHLILPENFGLFDRTFRARVYPRSMDRASSILAISNFTRQTLIERCGVNPAKITVVPYGIEPSDTTYTPTALVEGPYLYYPAATYPHKDHETLLRTYAILRTRGALSERLVLSGQKTALWRRRLEPLIRTLGIAQDVVHLGFVPFVEVKRLIVGSSAVVFPTRFEGFGLPVLEAAQLGAKLVTSRLAVFDEVGVPRNAQVDFADADALLTALGNEGPTPLERAPWTWRDTVQRTMDLLREAAR